MSITGGSASEKSHTKPKFGRRTKSKQRKKLTSSSLTNEALSVFPINLTITNITHRLLISQLAILPDNVVEIGAVRIADVVLDEVQNVQYPLTAILYPLRNKANGYREPFPTCFWLTCPHLHKRISKLEDMGWINKLNIRLHGEQSSLFLSQMASAHNNYIQYRWNLLSEADKEYFIAKKWDANILSVGISGMNTHDNVKCLHTHYAHYITRPDHGNIIGKWVDELLLENGLHLDQDDSDIRNAVKNFILSDKFSQKSKCYFGESNEEFQTSKKPRDMTEYLDNKLSS